MNNPQSRNQISFHQAKLIIGLEVHVQLDTKSKLFCGCSTKYGAPPNSQTCPVCAGMPGALPVPNDQALTLAIKTGLALECEIAQQTTWVRKQYAYPDLPKGYQISQLDMPVCGAGYLDIPDASGASKPRRIQIERAHLEEDAGKMLHADSASNGASKIDLNRAGIPLLEIVTRPDLRTPAEAKTFLTELSTVLTSIGVSRCIMAFGNLRCDANINLHIKQDREIVATPIVEIKNLNSLRALEQSLEYEAQRQFDSWKQSGDSIDNRPIQTRGWDSLSQATFLQREKESSADYRFFPDPDLPPILISPDRVAAIKANFGNWLLPSHAREFLAGHYRIKQSDANLLVRQGRGVIDYFQVVADGCESGQLASNWITQEVLGYLRQHDIEIEKYPVTPESMVELLIIVGSGELDQTRAKEVLTVMTELGVSARDAISQLGVAPVEASDLEALCKEVFLRNESIVQEIRDGNTRAMGALIGRARKLNPNADPRLVGKLFNRLIEQND